MNRASPYEYVLNSRCNFEQKNIKDKPIDGVFLRGVSHTIVKAEKRFTFEVYLLDYKLTLQILLPLNYPIFPPSARLISDTDSVLPDHPDVDQAEGYIERVFDPAEWTPCITIRDYIRAILTLVKQSGARNWTAEAKTMPPNPKTVHGFHKDHVKLTPQQYLILIKDAKSTRFIDDLRYTYCCRIRFFGGLKGAEVGRNYLRVEADEISAIHRVRDKIEGYLRKAETALMEKQKREKFDAAAKAAAKSDELDAYLASDKATAAISAVSAAISEISNGASYAADWDPAKCQEKPEEVDHSMQPLEVILDDEISTPLPSNQNSPNPGASSSTTGPIVAAESVTPSGISNGTATVPKSQPAATASIPFLANGQTSSQFEPACPYCFVHMPAESLKNHQEMYCWRAPKIFQIGM